MAETAEMFEEPEEGVTVELEDESAEPTPELVVDDNDPNLAITFARTEEGKEALKKIAQKVIQDFDDDWSASEEYRNRVTEDWNLFVGDLPPKTFPFKDCANANVPIMMENITRVEYRLYGEIFGDWQNVFGVPAIGPDPVDREVAEILTLHGNWQLREGIPDFKRQMHRFLLANLVIGDVTVDSYWDPVTQMNRHEVLTPEEFVIPFVFTTTMPDYSDVPRKTKILPRYRHELEKMKGAWNDVDTVLDMKASWDDEPEQVWAEAMAHTSGIELPETSDHAPYRLLQYDGWFDLPTQEEQRYVRAIVDRRTMVVLELKIHEEPNWQDQARYDRQIAEKDRYLNLVEQHQQAQAVMQQQMQQIQLAVATRQIAPQQAVMMQQQLQQQVPPPPQMPNWMESPEDSPEPPRKEPVNMYTHSVGIEPLRGALGISYGRGQADYSRAANTLFSQYADSATLANAWGIVTPDTVRFEEPFEIAPGRHNKATGISGRELKESIIELKPGQANPQLKELIETVYSFSRTSMQSPEVLSGEPGKSGETYRGIAARIEQATKQLSVYGQKITDDLKQVLRNNARLNAIFLPEEEMIRVADHLTGDAKFITVGRDLYARSVYGYHVEFRADMRFATKAQQIAEADEILQFPAMVPPLQMNPAFIYAATRKALEARGAKDMIQLLGQPPPPPPMFGAPPPGMGGPPGGPGGPPGNPTGSTPAKPPEQPAAAQGPAPGGAPGPKTGPPPGQTG